MATAQELREQLVNEFNMSEEEANSIKGKTELMNVVNSLSASSPDLVDTLFDELEEDEPVVNEEEQEDPSYNSPLWSDFVMTKFQEDELVDGNPNINGLRRVTNELLGEVIKSVPTSVMPCMGGFACSYEVSIVWDLNSDGNKGMGDYGIKVFGGVADANENNTDRPYSDYLAAMAETRAEVRALRKALRLKGVAHEEVKKSYTEEKTVTWDSGDSQITPQQISLIKNKCISLEIDLDKFVQTRGTVLEKLTRDDGSYLIQEINKFQTQHKEVPEELKITKEETKEEKEEDGPAAIN